MKMGLGLGINRGMAINEQKFISVWKTDNISIGSSNNNQVKLPLEAGGTYNFTVDWGDGTSNVITAWDQAEVTHTYLSIGTYTIKIKGIIRKFIFSNSGDRLKILEIKNNGPLEYVSTGYIFWGCENLIGIPENTMAIESIEYMLRGCVNFVANINFKCVNLLYADAFMHSAEKFDSLINIDTSNIIRMNFMFLNCVKFNQSLSHFNTANVTNMCYMFLGCGDFNQSLSHFNTAKVTDMSYMLYNCSCFNQDISSWNIEAVTTMEEMLTFSTAWSTENYDKALISWAAQNVKSGVLFKCSTRYTLGGAAENARTYLTGTKGWTILDLGGI